MSHQVTITKMIDGPRHAIFHIYLESEGTEGELKNYVVVDPEVDFGIKSLPISITQVWSSLIWFDASLSFDALEPYPGWTLARDTGNHVDFRHFGGIKDRTDAERTGKIYLTTNGFEDVGSRGTIILEVKKGGK